MRVFFISLALLLATAGLFFVPISFSVDGFGLVVDPGGVRTIKANKDGRVHHFPSDNGQFGPGDIVSAVTFDDVDAINESQRQIRARDLARIETEHLEDISKIEATLDRDRAKLVATQDRVAARADLIAEAAQLLDNQRAFSLDSAALVADLNEERRELLNRLEDLVRRSGEVSALPAQRLASVLDDIQSDRLSVINSESALFNEDQKLINNARRLHQLNFENSIDTAELEVLANLIRRGEEQLQEQTNLRQKMRDEADARYLQKIELPNVMVAYAPSFDMRRMQSDAADVGRGEALRLLAGQAHPTGLSIVVFGAATSVRIKIRSQGLVTQIELQDRPQDLNTQLATAGVPMRIAGQDARVVGTIPVRSIFLAPTPQGQIEDLVVLDAEAFTESGLPVPMRVGLFQRAKPNPETTDGTVHRIVGFLENRHAVGLQPGTTVRGAVSDVANGAELSFDAELIAREVATVDTNELGVRLGNHSLARKIIERGVLSQIVVAVEGEAANQMKNLQGAVVRLTVPLARKSLFDFLVARNVAI